MALHGGGYSAAYWDSPLDPGASLLTLGADLGYHVIALDRPGYGRSHGLTGDDVRIARQADVVLTLIDDLRARGDVDHIFLVGHSMGAILAIHCAADPRGRDLSGIEFSGLPLEFKSELADPIRLAQIDYLPEPPAEFRRDLFYGPDGSFDPRTWMPNRRSSSGPPRQRKSSTQRLAPRPLPRSRLPSLFRFTTRWRNSRTPVTAALRY